MEVGYVCENCKKGKGKVFIEVVQCCSYCGLPLTPSAESEIEQLNGADQEYHVAKLWQERDEAREALSQSDRLVAVAQGEARRYMKGRDEAREAAREIAECRPVMEEYRESWLRRFPWLAE
jgi:hypothetical protein